MHISELLLGAEKLISTNMARSGPFVFGTQDKDFMLDGKTHKFPDVPGALPYIVDYVLARRYAGAWRFSPSNMHGRPRQFTGKPSNPNSFGPNSWIAGGVAAIAIVFAVYAFKL